MPGSFRSSMYFAAPVIRRGSSTRLRRGPTPSVVVSASSVVIDSPRGGRVRGRLLDGLDDVLVAGAAAEVALQTAPNLRLGQTRPVRAEQLRGGHDDPRRAETALQAVPLPESLLERMELAVAGQALDGRDLGA